MWRFRSVFKGLGFSVTLIAFVTMETVKSESTQSRPQHESHGNGARQMPNVTPKTMPNTTSCSISEGWNLRGYEWGCCGNYDGCCTYASFVCYIHDAMCRCCDVGERFCGPKCKPEPDCIPSRRAGPSSSPETGYQTTSPNVASFVNSSSLPGSGTDIFGKDLNLLRNITAFDENIEAGLDFLENDTLFGDEYFHNDNFFEKEFSDPFFSDVENITEGSGELDEVAGT